jgi:hypothetical protein
MTWGNLLKSQTAPTLLFILRTEKLMLSCGDKARVKYVKKAKNNISKGGVKYA